MAGLYENKVIIDIFCEFLEVAIHNILYLRQLYPEGIFLPKKKYGLVVHQSQHPLLNEYIEKSVKTAYFHAKTNQLKKFLLCVTSGRDLVENYVFDIIDMKFKSESDPMLLNLEKNLRTFCLKLSTADIYLKPLPSYSEFTIQIHTTEYSALAYNGDHLSSDFPLLQMNENSSGNSFDIIPIHTVDTENLKVQIYIEKPSEITD